MFAGSFVGRGFMVGVLVGSFLQLGTQHALAVTCQAPQGTGWTVNDFLDGTQYGAEVVNNSTAKGLLIVDSNPQCAEIRSTLVFQDNNNYAEVGMWQDPSGQLIKCPQVNNPHLLVFARVGPDTPKCKQDAPSLTAGDFVSVRVQNPAHNNTANYYLDTGQGWTFEGSYNINFNQGEIWSYDEHHYSSDGLHANVDGLKFLGGAGNWNSWDSTNYFSGHDTGNWLYCNVSLDHYHVEQQPCPP